MINVTLRRVLNTKVSDLIHPHLNTWNAPHIRSVFEFKDAQQIMVMKLQILIVRTSYVGLIITLVVILQNSIVRLLFLKKISLANCGTP